MNGRTYCGFYKGHYLKSTLEYVYAVYLDYMGFNWDYEVETFSLPNGGSYKPDFYLIDSNEFVEVKGGFNYEVDLPRIDLFRAETRNKVTILRDKDLRLLIKQTPFVFNQLVKAWKAQAISLGMDTSGSNNPRYGVSVAQSTKDKISARAKQRFEDPVFRAKFAESVKLRSSNPAFIQNRDRFIEMRKEASVKSHTRVCSYCGETFDVTKAFQVRNNQKYCSTSCSAKSLFTKSDSKAKDLIRGASLEFSSKNNEALQTSKLNKVKPLLESFYKSIEDSTGIKDPRTICKALGIKESRKALLLYLRSLAENVLGASTKKEVLELRDKEPAG